MKAHADEVAKQGRANFDVAHGRMVAKNGLPLWGSRQEEYRRKVCGWESLLDLLRKRGRLGMVCRHNHPHIHCSAFDRGMIDFICYEKGVRGRYAEGFAEPAANTPKSRRSPDKGDGAVR